VLEEYDIPFRLFRPAGRAFIVQESSHLVMERLHARFDLHSFGQLFRGQHLAGCVRTRPNREELRQKRYWLTSSMLPLRRSAAHGYALRKGVVVAPAI
jgi:hypothetical protein